MLHALIVSRALSHQDAVDSVTGAAGVKAELAAVAGESPGRLRASLALLAAIKTSLEADAPPPPRH